MRSLVTAVIAAIEACAAAAVGVAAVVVPALLLWMVTFSLAAEPATVFAGAAAVWALAHFAPLSLVVPPELALSLGLPPEELTFGLSLAPLGVTLITVLLALRAGDRLSARGGAGAAGVLGGALGFAGAALVIAQFAAPFLSWPGAGVAAVAALVYGVPAGLAFLVGAARHEHPWWRAGVRLVQRGIEGLGFAGAAALPARAAEVCRLGAASLAALLGLAAVTVAIALIVGYSGIVALTQHLQLDPLGSALLFLTQLALLPVAVLWGLAWLLGSGFAVGAGSSVTPFETLLGPLPALPIFGAIPQGWGAFGALAPALVVLVGVGVAVLLGRRAEARRASWAVAVTVPVVAAILVGFAVTALSALATGAIGPDRLSVTGPNPWVTGGLAAAELGLGLLIGTAAARIDARQWSAALPDLVPERVRERLSAEQADEQLTVPLDDAVQRLSAVELDAAFAEAAELAAPDPADARSTDDSDELGGIDHSHGYDPDPNPDTVLDVEDGGDGDAEAGANDTGAPEPETPADPEADPAPNTLTDVDDAVSESEALRAYEWNDTVDLEPEAPQERTGWRWPRPGR